MTSSSFQDPVAHRSDPTRHSLHASGELSVPVRLTTVTAVRPGQSMTLEADADVLGVLMEYEEEALQRVQETVGDRRLHSCIAAGGGVKVRIGGVPDTPGVHDVVDACIHVKGVWVSSVWCGVVATAEEVVVVGKMDDGDDMTTQDSLPAAFHVQRPDDLVPADDDDAALTDDESGFQTEVFHANAASKRPKRATRTNPRRRRPPGDDTVR